MSRDTLTLNRGGTDGRRLVHESAIVDDGAIVGEGTRIWHFSHVMCGARIGRDCTLGQNVFVASNVTIGNGVKIQNNVSLYEGVTIDDFVFCGPSCVFTNVTNPRAELPRGTASYATTHVKRGASIGANATIVCGSEIGRYAFIGAGAVIVAAHVVPDYALMLGVPAKRVGWISRHGAPLSSSPSSDGGGGVYRCSESGFRYREVEPNVLRCLDLDEEAPLR